MFVIRLHDFGIMYELGNAILEIVIVFLFELEIKAKSFLRHSITDINFSTLIVGGNLNLSLVW